MGSSADTVSQEIEKLVRSGIQSVFRTTECALENMKEGEHLEKMKNAMGKYCMIEDRHAGCMQALKTIESDILRDNSEELILFKNIQKMFAERMPESDFDSRDYSENENVKRLQQIINDACEAGPSGDQGSDDGDDELTVTEQELVTFDPFTKQTMTDPVKNKLCGHNYERDVIMELIGKSSTKCPIVGCQNRKPITKKDLETNAVLKRHIDTQSRRGV